VLFLFAFCFLQNRGMQTKMTKFLYLHVFSPHIDDWGKWEMGNGKWEMGNGKWEMGNGKWEMGNGKWDKCK